MNELNRNPAGTKRLYCDVGAPCLMNPAWAHSSVGRATDFVWGRHREIGGREGVKVGEPVRVAATAIPSQAPAMGKV